jgi:hypothetical protein
MTQKNKSSKILILVFVLFSILHLTSYLLPVSAQCPPNVVPNPLDPNCEAAAITPGTLVNRLIVFLPYLIVIVAAGGYGYGAWQIITGGEDGKENGIKTWIRVTLGLVGFFSIGLALFILSIVTGFDLLGLIGL